VNGSSIDALIDEVIVLDDNPAVDDALILKLQYDLALQLHPFDEIAIRYGLRTPERLYKYLKGHPNIVAGVKKLRANLESEEGVEARVRLKALAATENLIIPTASIAADPRIPAQQRIDAFKQLNRVGGVDGSQAANKNASTIGANFVLNIHFRNGSDETIVATVAPPDEPRKTTRSPTLEDDDDPEFEDEDI
jgi:hypothetical protein